MSAAINFEHPRYASLRTRSMEMFQ